MYRTILFLLSFFMLNSIGLGQSNFLSVEYRFGQPLDLKPQTFGLDEGYEYQNAENIFEQGLGVDYAHAFWKKFLLYGNVGFDLSGTRRYQKLVDFRGRRHIDNIILNDYRFDIHLGIEKRFALFDSKLMINTGWRLVLRTSFEKSIDYTSDFRTFDYGNGNFIAYRYDLTTHHGTFYKNPAGINQSGKVGNEFFAGFNIKMTDNIYFNFNMNLTTHNVFYYDYSYEALYFTNGIQTLDVEVHGFLSERKFGVKNNFFFLSTGLSFNLGKK